MSAKIFTWSAPSPFPPTTYEAVDGQEIFLYLGDVLIVHQAVAPDAISWSIPVNGPGTYHIEVWAVYETQNGVKYSELCASDDFTISGTPKTPTPTDSMIAPPSDGEVTDAP